MEDTEFGKEMGKKSEMEEENQDYLACGIGD